MVPQGSHRVQFEVTHFSKERNIDQDLKTGMVENVIEGKNMIEQVCSRMLSSRKEHARMMRRWLQSMSTSHFERSVASKAK